MKTIVIWGDYRNRSVAFIPQDSGITQEAVGNEPGKVYLINTQFKLISIKFVVVEGDYRHLDRVYINGYNDNRKIAELNDLLYNAEGKEKLEMLDNFPLPLQESDAVIIAGILP